MDTIYNAYSHFSLLLFQYNGYYSNLIPSFHQSVLPETEYFLYLLCFSARWNNLDGIGVISLLLLHIFIWRIFDKCSSHFSENCYLNYFHLLLICLFIFHSVADILYDIVLQISIKIFSNIHPFRPCLIFLITS